MRLKISTSVRSSLEKVQDGFNEDLFVRLSPPFPKVKLLRFDGSETGNIVSLQLNFIFFRQEWTSEIVSGQQDTDRWVFVDKGIKLPFFLSSWVHHHEVRQDGEGAIIIDDISYSTGWMLTDLILYLPMYLQFLYRKPIYRKAFT